MYQGIYTYLQTAYIDKGYTYSKDYYATSQGGAISENFSKQAARVFIVHSIQWWIAADPGAAFTIKDNFNITLLTQEFNSCQIVQPLVRVIENAGNLILTCSNANVIFTVCFQYLYKKSPKENETE